MKKILLPIIALLLSTTIFSQEQVPTATNATAGKLSVSFAVTSQSAKSYLAVYVTNSANQLVNTLSYQYGSSGGRYTQLTTFWSLVGPTYNTANFKFVGTPDGTSGATFTGALAAKTVYWGQSATMATAVAALADGDYKVNFEIVRENNNRNYGTATFTKGAATSTPVVAAITGFANMTVSWVPANTAVQDVELQKLYNLYPSPAVSSIYVSGLGIEGIDICSLSAKILMHSNEQKVNISQLPKGAYLAVVYTNAGMVVKKFQKM